nr:hypothetical protein B0A51_06516 [Rachicladosporium sp. CCFEE 5018]
MAARLAGIHQHQRATFVMDATQDDQNQVLRDKFRHPQTEKESDFWYYSPSDWDNLLTAAVNPEIAAHAKARLSQYNNVGRVMETADGITIAEHSKCLPCRKASSECQVRADKKSSKCAKCYHSSRACSAGTDAPRSKRGAPRRSVEKKPRKCGEIFRRHHLTGQGAAYRKCRDRTGEDDGQPGQIKSGAPVTEDHTRYSLSTPAEAAPTLARYVSDQETTSPSSAANGFIRTTESPLMSLTGLSRASSVDTQATFERGASIKTEHSDKVNPLAPALTPGLSNTQQGRASPSPWPATIADEEIEALRAEAASARADAAASQLEATLMKKVFERSKRRLAMVRAVDLIDEYRRPETEDQGNNWYYAQDDWERLLLAATVPEDAPSATKRLGMFSRAGRLMETPYGIPTKDSERYQRSKRCGRCWVSNEQCHANPITDSATRARVTTNGPRQTRKRRENFKKNHLMSRRTGPRKTRVEVDARDPHETAASTLTSEQAARIEDSLVPDALFNGQRHDSEREAKGLAGVSTI